jgi:diguanylate cyclase (GGDEF)-like protein
MPDNPIPPIGDLDGWLAYAGQLDYALQPIVNAHTGHAFGYEALVRGFEGRAYADAQAVFDAAWAAGALPPVEVTLRERAIRTFTLVPDHQRRRLFTNIDTRFTEWPGFVPDPLIALCDRYGLTRANLCLELSERALVTSDRTLESLSRFRAAGFQLALHDFGTGATSFRLVYELKPHYLKLARFLIEGIDSDHRKKVLASSLVAMAHAMGCTVIAEGVETDRELAVCRDMGVALVQGFLIAPPTIRTAALPAAHTLPDIASRVGTGDDIALITQSMDEIAPLSLSDPMDRLIERLRQDPQRTVLPVIDAIGQPVGVIREKDLKRFLYAPFGRELLRNRGLGTGIPQLVTPCATVDINTRAEQIVEIFSGSDAEDGILVTREETYAGFLSTVALVRMVHEKNIAVARDQNPLTKLPGNNVILDYVSKALADEDNSHALVYIDFDHFKPFNDHYGFLRGDQAILLFADLARDHAANATGFAGHVGGDDFFLGLRGLDADAACSAISHLLQQFREGASALYDDEDRARGWLKGHDRDGNEKLFPLLGASAVIVSLGLGRGVVAIDSLNDAIAHAKGDAKLSPTRIAQLALTAHGAVAVDGPA